MTTPQTPTVAVEHAAEAFAQIAEAMQAMVTDTIAHARRVADPDAPPEPLSFEARVNYPLDPRD